MYWMGQRARFVIDGRRRVMVTDLRERIVGVSAAWVQSCGFTPEEAFGNTPQILQGALTDLAAARGFSAELKATGTARVTLLNYTKDRRVFLNCLQGRCYGDVLIAESRSSFEASEHGFAKRQVVVVPDVLKCDLLGAAVQPVDRADGAAAGDRV